MAKFIKHIETARNAALNIALVGLALLIGYAFYNALSNDEMVFDPIGMPKTIRELGYSEDAAAMTLAEGVRSILRQAENTGARFSLTSKFETPDISVPVAGLSFDAIVRLVRQALGWQQLRVVGEFVCTAEPCRLEVLELRLRLLNGREPPVLMKVRRGSSIDELTLAGAEEVLRHTDPLGLVSYLYDNKANGVSRRSDAIALAETMVAEDHPNKVWALNYIGLDRLEKAAEPGSDLTPALQAFQLASEAAPKLSVPLNNWAMALSQGGEKEAAAAKYREAIALEPNQSVSRYNLGVVLRDQGKYEQAITVFQEAAALFPADPDIFNGLGSTYLQKGDKDQAAKAFEKAKLIAPEDPATQFNLGLAYMQQQKKAEARTAFETYLNLSPQATDRSQVEDYLRQLK